MAKVEGSSPFIRFPVDAPASGGEPVRRCTGAANAGGRSSTTHASGQRWPEAASASRRRLTMAASSEAGRGAGAARRRSGVGASVVTDGARGSDLAPDGAAPSIARRHVRAVIVPERRDGLRIAGRRRLGTAAGVEADSEQPVQVPYTLAAGCPDPPRVVRRCRHASQAFRKPDYPGDRAPGSGRTAMRRRADLR